MVYYSSMVYMYMHVYVHVYLHVQLCIAVSILYMYMYVLSTRLMNNCLPFFDWPIAVWHSKKKKK